MSGMMGRGPCSSKQRHPGRRRSGRRPGYLLLRLTGRGKVRSLKMLLKILMTHLHLSLRSLGYQSRPLRNQSLPRPLQQDMKPPEMPAGVIIRVGGADRSWEKRLFLRLPQKRNRTLRGGMMKIAELAGLHLMMQNKI